MTHGRKPRQRREMRPPFVTALMRATKHTPEELASIMVPMRACLKAVREGVATQLQFEVLQSSMVIAEAIEHSGIVRGLSDHIASALQACSAIEARALTSGAWRQTALYFQELDALAAAVDLHEYQLQQLSAGELHRIVQQTMARTSSSGGNVVRISETDLALMAA
ncbi:MULTISPECIES: hypothetical protein [unclassified Acidovorax]|uniref:hypothetical protein n=1 Tax=unclassified Acidovorax TaxID=2684926 RepID=UPI001C448249|nr:MULTISPECIES: hypothetical protein [unclassified Acidovorax]MBV7459811.1 hypothetical protein [Acidovorax sp. sif0632]MBV7464836.1 hypothetical protein [Acidovorax sp. sif0613]